MFSLKSCPCPIQSWKPCLQFTLEMVITMAADRCFPTCQTHLPGDISLVIVLRIHELWHKCVACCMCCEPWMPQHEHGGPDGLASSTGWGLYLLKIIFNTVSVWGSKHSTSELNNYLWAVDLTLTALCTALLSCSVMFAFCVKTFCLGNYTLLKTRWCLTLEGFIGDEFIWSSTGKCKDANAQGISSLCPVLVSTQGAAFWINWTLLKDFLVQPKNRELQ